MTMRYRQAYPKTDESLDPRDWNNNMREIASEFNGYLDRDNIPKNVIDLSMVKFGAFTKVHNDPYDDTAGDKVVFDIETSSWQKTDGTNPFGRISINVPCDAFLVCEFSARILLSGTPTNVVDFVRFRITVDGETVGINGFSAMTEIPSQPLFVSGSIPVLAGTRRVNVEGQLGSTYGGDFRLLQVRGRPEGTATVEAWQRELVVIEERR